MISDYVIPKPKIYDKFLLFEKIFTITFFSFLNAESPLHKKHSGQ